MPSVRCHPERPRSRWPAIWPPPSGRPGCGPTPRRARVELDLRTPNGLRRSRLLHRLVALGVPWGILRDGRGTSGTFRETWQLAWEPELSVRLIEMAGHGTTVVAAATSCLDERAAAADRLAEATATVELALLSDLPGALGPALQALGELAARAPDIADLMDALGPVASALRYGDVRGTERRDCARCSTSWWSVWWPASTGRRAASPMKRRPP